MDYNKWGVVTGIVGLVFLLIYPLIVILSYLLPKSILLTATYLFFMALIGLVGPLLLILPVPLFGIATLVFGILSMVKGEKKKTALIFGIVYILLIIFILIYFLYFRRFLRI